MGLPYENATSGSGALDDIRKVLTKFGCSRFGTMTDNEAGELPKPIGTIYLGNYWTDDANKAKPPGTPIADVFNANQMREYALASIRALGEQEARQVEQSWINPKTKRRDQPVELEWRRECISMLNAIGNIKCLTDDERMLVMRAFATFNSQTYAAPPSHHQPQEPVEALKKQSAEAITAELLLRSVFNREDLTEHGREQFFKEFMRGQEELIVCWGDFRMMAATARAAIVTAQRHGVNAASLTDGEINEITLAKVGKWPTFEAQSWACKVVHAVLSSPSQSPELSDEPFAWVCGDDDRLYFSVLKEALPNSRNVRALYLRTNRNKDEVAK